MSWILMIIIFYVGVIGLAVMVMFYGKEEGNSIWDRLYRVFGIYVPRYVKLLARCCCGARGPEYVQNTWNYIVWQNNPIVQVFYLILIFAGYGIFVIQGYPHIPSPFIAWWHKYTGFVHFLWCIYNFAMCSMLEPGVVTKKNENRLMREFPPDNQIFFSKTTCSTCMTLKPARSKHCGLCGWCVSKFDHHCIWVNNCIGLKNHYHFLMFLFSNALLCCYGAYLGGTILWEYVVRLKLFEAVFIDPRTQERLQASYVVVMQYLMHTHGYIVFVILLAAVMCVVLLGFWGWHMYLVLRGTTSNEMAKWSGLRRYLSNKYKDDQKQYAIKLEEYEDQQAQIFSEKPLGEHEDILEPPKVPVDYSKTLVNLYHRGWWGNLLLVVFPPDIHSEGWIDSESTVELSRFAVVSDSEEEEEAEVKKEEKGGKGKKKKNSKNNNKKTR